MVAFTCACSPLESSSLTGDVSWYGRIDDSAVTEISSKSEKYGRLTIGSPGGETRAALQISNIIEERHLSVTVVELCLSACAEYILPAAREITLENNPLIGFHWNPIMLEELLHQNANKDLEYCTRIGADDLRKLLNRRQKPSDAWRETLQRIKLREYKVDYKDGECPWSYRDFENKFWFPKSSQLNDIFGLEFNGSLCADDPSCYLEKLSYMYRLKGGRFVVGEENVEIDIFRQPN